MVPLNSFSMDIIFNFLWFCQIRYGLDMILLSINQLWKPNSFSHPLRDWFKSEIISRNLFIGQLGDTVKFQKNTWRQNSSDKPVCPSPKLDHLKPKYAASEFHGYIKSKFVWDWGDVHVWGFLPSPIRSPLKPGPLLGLLWLFRISKILELLFGRGAKPAVPTLKFWRDLLKMVPMCYLLIACFMVKVHLFSFLLIYRN